MKRLLFLNIDLTQIPDNTPKSKWKEWEHKLAEQVVKDFEQQAKSLPQLTILKNYLPDAQVLIELKDDQYQTVYDALRQMDVIQTIDSILRKE